jgi:serine/threonine protein kinase
MTIVADFGVSVQLDSINSLMYLYAGTMYDFNRHVIIYRRYMAPEVSEIELREEGYGIKIDIWSLGIMILDFINLYGMCIITEEPQYWTKNHCTDKLNDLLDMCLNPDVIARADCGMLLNADFFKTMLTTEQLLVLLQKIHQV